MSYVLKLREQRAKVVDEARGIPDAARAAERLCTKEEREKVELYMARAAEIDAEITQEEKLSSYETKIEQPVGRRVSVIRDERDKQGDSPFSSFAEQLLAVHAASLPGAMPDPRLRAAASGANETVPSEGGFLVQKDFAAGLMQRTYEASTIADRVRRAPIGPNSNGIKFNALDENSRANGSRWGGILAYWTPEAGQKTASTVKFRQVELNLHKLTGLFYATDELLQDAAFLPTWIEQSFAQEFAFQLDDAILNGDGAGKPLGILQSPSLVIVSKEATQQPGTILFQNIINMRARLWAPSRMNAIWLINQDIEPALMSMSMTVGTGGVPVFLPASGIATEGFDTLFGRPIVPIEQAFALGQMGDIMLIDPSQYLLIDKGGIQQASSIHVRFVYDETVFRFVYRVDGQPLWNKPLTPYRGTGTRSPFVTLEPR